MTIYGSFLMKIETLEKPRGIVLADITNEPDDEQSMVRFLCYINEFDVEGFGSNHLSPFER